MPAQHPGSKHVIRGWKLRAAHFVWEAAGAAAETDSYMPMHLGQGEDGKGHPCGWMRLDWTQELESTK